MRKVLLLFSLLCLPFLSVPAYGNSYIQVPIAQWNELKSNNSEALSSIQEAKSELKSLQTVNEKQKSELIGLQITNDNQKRQLSELNALLREQSEQLKETQKSLKKLKKGSTLKSFVVGIGVGVLAGVLLK